MLPEEKQPTTIAPNYESRDLPFIFHPPEIDEDIVYCTTLSSFNLAFNQKVKVIICQKCRRHLFPVILPSELPDGCQAIERSLAALEKSMEMVLSELEVTEQQLVPFFRVYRWHAVIKGIDVAGMLRFIDTDHTSRVEDFIRKATFAYITDTNDLLKNGKVHSWVLKRVSVKDSTQG